MLHIHIAVYDLVHPKNCYNDFYEIEVMACKDLKTKTSIIKI